MRHTTTNKLPGVVKQVVLIIISLYAISTHAQASKGKSVHVIFDTDMATDYDDIGAITLLHYYADQGKVNILATIASTKYPRVAGVLSVMNTYFNRPDIPIGVPTGAASADPDWQKWSDTLVAKYPHKIRSNDEAMDAVKLYRKILAKQPDNSVAIITIGFFTNVANLLRSAADEYSPLSGQQLVDKKVIKMVSMAGKFPVGWEYNMDNDSLASKCVFSHFTKPIIFSGFEIGEKIHTGIPLIHNEKIINDPVKDVFRISIPQAKEDVNGRMSWDETAVYIAVNGPAPYYKLVPGKIQLNANGSDNWVETGNQYYLLAIRPPSEMEAIINNILIYQPTKK
ncbi:Inosine-uridine preferring nucleoside hydrolase [Mucilaginibacter mallensis]|uniref:Inosine-uridine preferring nucleoside hydrolase n=1 Tax=Mucilaginibacter mallensis TaxID=652787 RepID=A0A1H1YEM5_MUCMA|nr:nucleoside hydrolase [Mucilaginibacter mallensis]SDT19466.1 Inosine-uridine preferring nucleoside hydrolase [Mucilaginibacter mallensis]